MGLNGTNEYQWYACAIEVLLNVVFVVGNLDENERKNCTPDSFQNRFEARGGTRYLNCFEMMLAKIVHAVH